MRRLSLNPRPDWRQKVEDCGLIWHSMDDALYWDESAAYSFSQTDISTLEKATAELYRLFLEAGDYIVEKRLFNRFGIPDWCEPLIIEAWHSAPPALNYGRFDLGYGGMSPPKLFEFNCDTPTSLLEAAVVQWFWKQEVFPRADQFNSLHERLIAKWQDIAPHLGSDQVHFCSVQDTSGEDAITTAYLVDTARQAGLKTSTLTMRDIGWAESRKRFYDLENQEIRTLYKLYPWEWLVHEPFGRKIAENAGRTAWIEPIWKMIWSNKAILVILWDLFPHHTNLLWARQHAPRGSSYVSKPLIAREGSNVTLVKDGKVVAKTDGPYDGQVIYQGLYDLPKYDGQSPVIGSWIVDGEPAGVGIREDGLITSNQSRFIPHIIE